MVVGSFYRGAIVISKRISGTILFAAGSGLYGLQLTTEATHNMTVRGINTTLTIRQIYAASGDITVDNVSLKEVSSLTVSAPCGHRRQMQPYVSAKLTITANTQMGLVINLDDSTTPQNCIHVWCDRVDGKIYAREMKAGVWQAPSLAGVAFTYSAGEPTWKCGTSADELYIWYNDAYVGSWTSTLTTANTKVALFATDPAWCLRLSDHLLSDFGIYYSRYTLVTETTIELAG